MLPLRPRPLVALCRAPLTLLGGCFAHVVLHDDDPVYSEVEPNDSALSAPFYGGVRPGDAFAIVGHVQESGFDLYDGAEVRVDAPCELVFDLESHAPYTDLDVCVYDPDLGEFVVCADGPADPEHGSVIVLETGKRLHLVVTSAWGDAEYTLRVHARSAVLPLHDAPVETVVATARPLESSAAATAVDRAKVERRRGYAQPPRVRVARPAVVLLYDLDRGTLERRAAVVERALVPDAPGTER
ncbi:MAG: hypothetical protein IPJ77_12330 [Planctomycetes bacterium]|nr:hypothetical protein [Planctomycetota bacterium]